jgi:hypothetical protein
MLGVQPPESKRILAGRMNGYVGIPVERDLVAHERTAARLTQAGTGGQERSAKNGRDDNAMLRVHGNLASIHTGEAERRS